MIARKITLAAVLLLIMSGTAFAKPLEPEPIPIWATVECVQTIQEIVSHEVGNMDEVAWRFLAEQVINDIPRLGCDNLTRWRWKIGNYPLRKISNEVIIQVWEAILDHPHRKYPRCQFVGMPLDVPAWRAAGYRISVDYRHSIGGLTVVGANCKL